MNISVAIADADYDYVDRLVEVLQQYDDLSIFLYSNVENLEDAIVKKHFDVVLFDVDFCDRRIAFLDTKLPVCLYRDGGQNMSLYVDTAKIVKYQRISNIYKDLVRLYADKAGISAGIDQSQNTKLIAVFSPVGGSGKTITALATGLKLRERGKQVLFISVEQMDSSANFNRHSEDGITSLLGVMHDRNVNFELKLKGLVKEGIRGLNYIEGFDRIVDYLDVKADEMTELFEKIKRTGAFHAVMIDLGSTLDEITKAVLDVADKVILVEKPGELERLKMDLFAEQSFYGDYGKKMFAVSNFAENNTQYSPKIDVPHIGFIHNYGNLKGESIIQNININQEISIEKLMD